ncbi:ABC transporter permease [Streptomyces sp. A012304]|uniref:ABC transporter permease n=1 Tax=Streptomyces sp. A012304 TaxID=375446 RepID=UPI00223255E3|nr:ABC transporter permease [Streptomyces sp. A012304]GKQ38483.1 hypothetical protein ALMP_50140 [Streptomyces sp. A012304]
MRRWWQAFGTGCWFALVGHARNRLAVVLAVGFLPTWIWLLRSVAVHTPVTFVVPAAGGRLSADTSHVMQITGALNAVTVIIGFMMFMATFKAGELDRRLVLAGFPRVPLLLAKVASLVITSVVVGLYCTVLLCWSWPVRQPAEMAAAVIAAGLVYGGLGIMLGSVLRGELEGLFVVIMTSIIDLGLQNPSANPLTDQAGLAALPLYGPMQTSLAAGFTSTVPPRYLGGALLWFVATCTAGLALFYLRTRSYPKPPVTGDQHLRHLLSPHASEPAT